MANEVKSIIAGAIGRYLRDSPAVLSATQCLSGVPEPARSWLITVIDSHSARDKKSYRDALLVQLAYSVAAGEVLDLTLRQPGARAVGSWLGQYLASNHIAAVKDAFQNIGKNTDALARGNYQEFDDFLRWASQPERQVCEITAAFEYISQRVASTARAVKILPEIDPSRLNFAAMAHLVGALLSMPSQGAYQQFVVAALLDAAVASTAGDSWRVETKSLNASDASSRTAGDIQILTGQRVIEAFEVTANPWEEKLAGAESTIRRHDLSRLHIVGAVDGPLSDALARLPGGGLDVSVLEVQGFCLNLVAALTRMQRAAALRRLYEMLDRLQPDVGLVNQYVDELAHQGLTQGAVEP